MQSLLNNYNSLSNVFKFLIIFTLVILFAAIAFGVSSRTINREAHEAMEPYNQSQAFIDSYFKKLERPVHLPEQHFNLFRSQQKIMSMRKNHYVELSRVFFRNYYGVLILKMIFSCIGGVVLFLMINRGWKDSSVTLKAGFLGIVMVITFCGFFPLVFKQEQNFNDNIKMYMDYTKAEVNIIDQLSRLSHPLFAHVRDTVKDDKGNSQVVFKPDTMTYFNRVDSMIAFNNSELNKLTNYILTIDAKEIKNMGDVYRVMQQATTGSSDTSSLKRNTR